MRILDKSKGILTLEELGVRGEAFDALNESIKKSHGMLLVTGPTGSGKTFMMASFINELNNQPQWDEDKAFIWITFSDDLAMQSRDKFQKYFENTLKNDLLTVDDFGRGKLRKNDITASRQSFSLSVTTQRCKH